MADKSYRFAVEQSQGIGWIENTGSAWVKPYERAGTIVITDSYGLRHTLVCDISTGLFYDISTYDGPATSAVTRAIADKETIAGTGGTAIAPSVTFREDRGSVEHYFLVHKRMHIHPRPYSESNQGASGYDDNGYLTGTEFACYLYDDGDTTAQASAANVNPIGPTVFDREVRAHRIQPKISCNKGNHSLVARQNYYVAEDVDPPPADLDTTEDDYEGEFAEPTFWASMLNSVLIDRYDGATLVASPTTATGPDGQARSGWTIAAAQNLGSVSLGATSTFLIWYTGTIAVTVNGVAVVLTAVDNDGTWYLAYASNVNQTGSLVITPTGAASLFSIRCYNSAISAGARQWLFDDVDDNEGAASEPRS